MQEIKEITGSFLVAADGARSHIRTEAEIDMVGKGTMQNLVNIHFMSQSLGRHLLQRDPAMLYFVFNADVVVVIVAHDLQAGEFVAQVGQSFDRNM